MSKNNYEGIHPYVVNQVRYHARSLMRHSAIHGVEVEDLEQELMLDYLSRKQAYDPEKAKWSTFVDRILNHKCASLIEAARALRLLAAVEAGTHKVVPSNLLGCQVNAMAAQEFTTDSGNSSYVDLYRAAVQAAPDFFGGDDV